MSIATAPHEETLEAHIAPGGLYRSDPAGVLTSRAFLIGGLMPSVESLAEALQGIRAAGHTADVVGFAIPLDGEPSAGVVRVRQDAVQQKRFDLMEFLLTALDPHRPSGWQGGRFAPGRNAPLAYDFLGNLVRWLVGIQTFQIHNAAGEEDVWVLARPNHAAAMHKVTGDSHEGYRGMLATLGVPGSVAAEFAARLAEGYCILTTCETDEGRKERDLKIMRKAGVDVPSLFQTKPLEVRYGVRPA